MTEISTEKLVKTYIKIRDKKAEIKKACDEQIADLDDQMKLITSTLLDIMKVAGSESLKTEFGSVSRSTKTRYWPSDWSAMYTFINEHKAPFLLEQRVHQGNMKEFLEQHPDQFPVGLNSESEFTVRITRPRNSKV
jgi:hypothetical protein